MAEPFLRLWFRGVAPRRALLVASPRAVRQELWRQTRTALLAEAWEELCRQAVPRLAESLPCAFGPAARSWSGAGPEWDVVARSLDRATLLLGECKWVEGPVSEDLLDRTYQELLRKGRPGGGGGPGTPGARGAEATDPVYVLFVPGAPPGGRALWAGRSDFRPPRAPRSTEDVDERQMIRLCRPAVRLDVDRVPGAEAEGHPLLPAAAPAHHGRDRRGPPGRGQRAGRGRRLRVDDPATKETPMVKTSQTHPLRIDWLDTGGARVGLTLAPGKHSTSLDGSRWSRDLDTDLEVFTAQGVTRVVCLLEQGDLERMGIAGLGDAVRGRGMEFVHFPIVDVSVPRADQAAGLDALLEGIEQAVAAGGRVVIHCEGGRGRSGVVAGCWLVRQGSPPEAALAELVRVRRTSQCPETEQQRDFIRQHTRRLGSSR